MKTKKRFIRIALMILMATVLIGLVGCDSSKSGTVIIRDGDTEYKIHHAQFNDGAGLDKGIIFATQKQLGKQCSPCRNNEMADRPCPPEHSDGRNLATNSESPPQIIFGDSFSGSGILKFMGPATVTAGGNVWAAYAQRPAQFNMRNNNVGTGGATITNNAEAVAVADSSIIQGAPMTPHR